jgi:SAM-dependent methyltransferase
VFPCRAGIWDFLPAARAAHFDRFLQEYGAVRRAEGRGSAEPGWYRRLPEVDPAEPLAWQWRVRARSLAALLGEVLPAVTPPAARVLDLGAGNGWLSRRLAQAGYRPLAVDVSDDEADGLGAARHFDGTLCEPFPRVRAEFDRLPLVDGGADVALFNASLHYSPDYDRTLAEACRVVAEGGAVVVLDSPVYHSDQAGTAMVAERHAAFNARFGFPSDALGSREYLTDAGMDALASRHGLRWRRWAPWYGLRWALRPWRSRLARRREPARFIVFAGRVERP